MKEPLPKADTKTKKKKKLRSEDRDCGSVCVFVLNCKFAADELWRMAILVLSGKGYKTVLGRNSTDGRQWRSSAGSSNI
jgi:hypothetical protein